MAAAIVRGADRIDRIVESLLDLSRLRLGEVELVLEPGDLAALVRRLAARFGQVSPEHRIQVSAPDPAPVRVDWERIERVLGHLLENAIKYSPEGGEIDLRVSVRESEVVVSVIDQGIGIPRQSHPRVFDYFYRAHAGTPHDQGGLGIGLAIARETITRHGGRIWFESCEEEGSAFHFALPRLSVRP
jgi:signal transduction histidine kinase